MCVRLFVRLLADFLCIGAQSCYLCQSQHYDALEAIGSCCLATCAAQFVTVLCVSFEVRPSLLETLYRIIVRCGFKLFEVQFRGALQIVRQPCSSFLVTLFALAPACTTHQCPKPQFFAKYHHSLSTTDIMALQHMHRRRAYSLAFASKHVPTCGH